MTRTRQLKNLEVSPKKKRVAAKVVEIRIRKGRRGSRRVHLKRRGSLLDPG